MAVLKIEIDKKRQNQIAKDLGVNRLTALGLLICFWDDAKRQRVVSATRESILELISNSFCDSVEREKAFKAMLKNKVFLQTSSDSFEIQRPY